MRKASVAPVSMVCETVNENPESNISGRRMRSFGARLALLSNVSTLLKFAAGFSHAMLNWTR